jgi:hypothetical protein
VNAAAQRPRRRETKRLAVFLGANNSRRFPPSHAVGHSAEGLKLLVAAIGLLALCLWGLWNEFF